MKSRRSLAPAVARARPIPNEMADRDLSPMPAWVESYLDSKVHHRCKPYPPSGRHHAGIWELLVRRLPLTQQAKAIAPVLMEHWPTIEPSLNRLRDLSGMSRGSVNNALFVLEHAGLLELQSEPGRRTRYVPHYPVRAVTENEVLEAFQSRRTPSTPGHEVATPSGTPGHEVATHPDSTWPTPGHDVDDPQPPGGHKVIEEAPNEASDRSPGEPLYVYERRTRLAREAAVTS